jgi:hypothetical protein
MWDEEESKENTLDEDLMESASFHQRQKTTKE